MVTPKRDERELAERTRDGLALMVRNGATTAEQVQYLAEAFADHRITLFPHGSKKKAREANSG